MEQEKIFVYYEYEKQLLHKTYKTFLQLNSKTPKIWLNSGQRVWIDTFQKKTFKWPICTRKGAQRH